MMDFVTAITILTEIAPANPQLLTDTAFFEELRKALLIIDFNRNESNLTYHQVFLLIFRLITYTLMSDRLDSRVVGDVCNFLSALK